MQKCKRNRTSAHFIYIFLIPRPESPWSPPEDPLFDLENRLCPEHLGCLEAVVSRQDKPGKISNRLRQSLVYAGGDILDRAHAVDFDQLFLRLVVGQ